MAKTFEYPTLVKNCVVFVNGRGQCQTLQRFIERVLDESIDKPSSSKIVVHRFVRGWWALMNLIMKKSEINEFHC